MLRHRSAHRILNVIMKRIPAEFTDSHVECTGCGCVVISGQWVATTIEMTVDEWDEGGGI